MPLASAQLRKENDKSFWGKKSVQLWSSLLPWSVNGKLKTHLLINFSQKKTKNITQNQNEAVAEEKHLRK